MCTYSCLPTVVPVSSSLFFFSFVVVSLLKLNTLFRYFHLVASFSPMTCAPLVSTRWSLISGLQATLSFHSLSFFLFLFFLVSSSSSCALPETPFVVVSLLKLNTLLRYFYLVAFFGPMTCTPLVSTRWSLISGISLSSPPLVP